jgi:hypothetical protein
VYNSPQALCFVSKSMFGWQEAALQERVKEVEAFGRYRGGANLRAKQRLGVVYPATDNNRGMACGV